MITPFNNTRAARKLAKHGFDSAWIRKAEAQEVEIAVYDVDGDFDRDATEDAWEKASEILGWGGYKSGWGSGVLRKGYTPSRQWNVR